MTPLPLLLLSLLGGGCGASQPSGPAPDHFPSAGAVKAAVYQGDLASLREATGQMRGGRVVEGASGDAEEALAQLHSALGFLLVAESAEEAGAGLAAMAQSCGDCHSARGATEAVGRSQAQALAALTDPQAQHPQLAEQLFHALVTADPAAGEPATAILSLAPLTLHQDPEVRARIQDYALRIHSVAQAPHPTAAEKQRELLAMMAGSCADCHAAAKNPAPAPPDAIAPPQAEE